MKIIAHIDDLDEMVLVGRAVRALDEYGPAQKDLIIAFGEEPVKRFFYVKRNLGGLQPSVSVWLIKDEKLVQHGEGKP